MQNKENLQALYAQIEDICLHFRQIRGEAAGILRNSQMPDANLHLNDILAHTEQAALSILEAAAAIGTLAETTPEETRQKINEYLGKIYEAASFQDISGQRIKIVMEHLNTLENQLQRLSDAARGEAIGPSNSGKDPLLNGPQLAANAPKQDDIDKLFGS